MPYKDAEKKKAYNAEYRSRPEVKMRMHEYYVNNNPRSNGKYYEKIYSITAQEYNFLFEKQQGCCDICGTHQTELKRRLAVDHCHTTGSIRGLLCTSCNTHLGIYEKYKETFENYLIKRN